MQQAPPLTPVMGMRKDFQQSWRLLKENFRPFIGIQIFAFAASIVTVLLLVLIYVFINPQGSSDFSNRFIVEREYRWVVIILVLIILIAFLNCQTGLAHDIMSSGDMFAQFKSSFTYFRQHWWKYVLISLITEGFQIVGIVIPQRMENAPEGAPIGSNSPNPAGFNFFMVLIKLLFMVGYFLFYCITIQSLASVNAQGGFIKSFVESYRIFRSNPKRVMLTWGLYFLIFTLPGILFEGILAVFPPSFNLMGPIIMIFVFLYNSFVIFVGVPLRALLVTGLYNNIEFQHVNVKN